MTDTIPENLRFNPLDRTISEWIQLCYERSIANGWYQPEDCDDMYKMGTKCALIHSEVSEMMEGLRKGLPDDHLPHRSMEEVEAADVFIRLADYCGMRGLDLASAVQEKLEYNQQRTDHKTENRQKDGGKKF